MSRRTVLIAGAAVMVVAAAYLLLPGVLQAFQGMHGPFGGGPAMHGR